MSEIKFERPKYSKKEMEKITQLKKDLPYPETFIDILFSRGYQTEEDIDLFFNSTINHLHNTELMKDSDKFVEILKEAIENKWLIINYSDYDVDGCTSAAIALRTIRNLGGNIEFYINNRFTGGYGMNIEGVNSILEKYPDVKLIITTDNGISAHEAVDYAKSKGIKVIVTDHHEVVVEDGKQVLPNADAVIDIKRLDETYPFNGLCGCGVIFKLMLYYYWITGNDIQYIYDLLDIVALGTQCDVVPLIDENRILVKEGLKLMRRGHRLSFEKLRLGMEKTKIDAGMLGYSFGPAINALGRVIGYADEAVEFLISEDEATIDEIVPHLVDWNSERKELTKEQLELAMQEFEGKEIPNVIVSYNENYHEGVAGIVAGRLKEAYNRPSVVLSPTHYVDKTYGRLWKASARSVTTVHLYECLCKLSKYLVTFGGHAMAAGFSMYESNIEEFTKKFNQLLEGTDFQTVITIDSLLDAKTLDIASIEELEMLEPFGASFSSPVFGLYNFEVDKEKSRNIYIKSGGIRLKNKEGLTLIMFHQGERYKELGEPQKLKAIGTPSINVYNGNSSPQFTVMNNYINI